LTLLSRVTYRGQEITAPRLRGLLALLAGDLRTGCSSARLVDGLWPHEQPEHPAKALQVVVSRARTQLGADVIASTPTGYRLSLAGRSGWRDPPAASPGGPTSGSSLGLLGGRDGHLVRHGGHGEPDRAVRRRVTTGNDDQVADRLLAGDQVEGDPLQRQDHDAIQDSVMSWRDAAFVVQVGQRLQIER
jgi:hypothetical protein